MINCQGYRSGGCKLLFPKFGVERETRNGLTVLRVRGSQFETEELAWASAEVKQHEGVMEPTTVVW